MRSTSASANGAAAICNDKGRPSAWLKPQGIASAGNPPSNPKLLDWLTDEFVKGGFHLKSLIRSILASRTYQLSARTNELNADDTLYFSHAFTKLLPAEVLLDAFSQVTQVPTTFSGYPAGWRSLQLPDTQPASSFLDAFGRPVRESTCSCERSAEPSMTQALSLLNGEILNT